MQRLAVDQVLQKLYCLNSIVRKSAFGCLLLNVWQDFGINVEFTDFLTIVFDNHVMSVYASLYSSADFYFVPKT